jgi:hypothetical protein
LQPAVRPNRFKEAFQESFNLVGLAGAVALSAATLNPIPLLAGIVLEVAYLLFVPDSKWYETRLDRKYDQEIIRRRNELKAKVFPQVRFSIRDRYVRLEKIREQIEAQSKSEDRWFREALRKLDFLMEKYLQFAEKEARFTSYLVSLQSEIRGGMEPPPVRKKNGRGVRVGEEEYDEGPGGRLPEPSEKWIDGTVEIIAGHYQSEIEDIENRLSTDPDFPTAKVAEKRKEILTRRREYVSRIGLIMHNLKSQMDLMHDTFGLINDEIRARSPEQVLADIDEVVLTSNSLTEAIEEVTPLEELVARLGA